MVARRMKRQLKSFGRRILGIGPPIPSPLLQVSQPSQPRGRVVITALTHWGFHGLGKVDPNKFFPPFCDVLATEGIATKFVRTPKELSQFVDEETCIIHIYREIGSRIDSDEIFDAQRRARVVFNHPSIGPLIGRKDEAHRLFTRNGIAMPARSSKSGLVFSNAPHDSAAPANVVKDLSLVDPERYNTEFIDTRVKVGDREYYTTVRIMCVGREIIHAFVRARDVREGSASVHAKDTPLDAGLINYLQDLLVKPYLDNFRVLAESIELVLGPGFYSHDLLIDKHGNVFVCEAGLKFSDDTYPGHLTSIAEACSCHAILFSDEFARSSARAFLREWKRASGIDREPSAACTLPKRASAA